MYSSDEKVKNVQLELLEIMKEFDRICSKHDIKYTLHGGTLLGAVREHGFISWDDDADVTMMSSEYRKLLKIFNKESEIYKLELNDIDIQIPRITKKVTPEGEDVIWLDIILYDYISENRIVQKLKFGITLFFQGLLRNKKTIKLSEGRGHSKAALAIWKFLCLIGSPFAPKRKQKWLFSFCSKWMTGSKKLIYRSNDQIKGMMKCLPAKCMKNFTYADYEDTKLMISKYYDTILTVSYGKNYMTPVNYNNDGVHERIREVYRNNE